MRIIKIVILMAVLLVLGGCAGYVGRNVDINARGICKASTEYCSGYSEGLKIEWSVSKGENGKKFLVGKLSGNGPTNYEEASFTLLLINGGKVTEVIGMVSGSGDFEKGIPFKCDITGKKYEATTIGYNFKYR